MSRGKCLTPVYMTVKRRVCINGFELQPVGAVVKVGPVLVTRPQCSDNLIRAPKLDSYTFNYRVGVHTSNVDGDVRVRVGAVEFKYCDFIDRHLMKSAAVDTHSGRISNINAPRTSYTST